MVGQLQFRGEEGGMISTKLGFFEASVSEFGGAKLNKGGGYNLPGGKWKSF